MGANRQFYSAVSVLVGSVVGVGIFGIPFVFAKAGFLTGFLFLAGLTVFILILNLAYGEIILRTDKSHQLVGYAQTYLGVFGKRLAFFAFILSAYAALLAYIIVGGEFLSNLFAWQFALSPAALFWLFFLATLAIIAGGLKTISLIDLLMLGLYAFGAIFLFGWSLPHWQLGNFTLFHPPFWFLPYGVLLFALTGSSIVLQREVLEGREHQLKKAIIWGTLVPSVIYLLFALAVVGVSGRATSPEAFSGLLPWLGGKVVWFGSLFGFLAIFTSFINLGGVIRESFQYDFHFKKWGALALTILPPWLMFVLGVKNFINVINLAGAVGVGLQSILFILIYGRVKQLGHRLPEYSLHLPKIVWYVMMGLALFGIIYTLGK